MSNKKKKSKNLAKGPGKTRRLSIREERMLRRTQGRRKARSRNSIIMLLMFIGLAAYFFWPRAQAPEVSAERLALNPSQGSENASVVLTEFGDFGCPACREWHQAGMLEQIIAQFDGQLRLEWRDLPIITGRSPKAAEAGQCAFDQGKFWEYHDNVYEQPDSIMNLSDSSLKRYAREIGLDIEAFSLCLDSNQHQSTVEIDRNFATQNGMRGTPSFMVNGRIVVGNPDLLVQAINEALLAQ
jgi:protein-disulfide isomerase